jgi:hypothetical protein
MATTELPLGTDLAANSSGFIFDVTLSTAIAANGKTETRALVPKGPLSPELLDKMDRYWRAANYLCIGQIYLFENPLLREPLKAEQIKPRLLGHWGTSPGQNLIYIHLNRLIKENNADIIREHLEDMPEIRNWQWTADFSDSAAPAPLAKGNPRKAMFTDS